MFFRGYCHAYIVIGVQHAGNVLCQISIQNGLDVITHIDYKGESALLMIILHHSLLTCTAVCALEETAAV